jgi:CBS domain-containing protein
VPVQVSEVMNRTNISETSTATLRDAAGRMWKQQTGSLVILDGGELIGIITERDIMKAVARGDDLDATPVSALMTRAVITVAPEDSVVAAAGHMATRWIRHLPVVSDGAVVGMVSQRDLCGLLVRQSGAPS